MSKFICMAIAAVLMPIATIPPLPCWRSSMLFIAVCFTCMAFKERK